MQVPYLPACARDAQPIEPTLTLPLFLCSGLGSQILQGRLHLLDK